MAIFCVTSMAQEVCHPPLTPFRVTREYDPVSEYTHSVGGSELETRVTTVDYWDNRDSLDRFDEFHSYGELTLFNPTRMTRRIKYRHTVTLPYGNYDVWQAHPGNSYQVCIQDNTVVFYHERQCLGGHFPYPRDWEYGVIIDPFGDVNSDGCIDAADIGLLIAMWGTDDPVMDLDSSGLVNAADLGILIANWTPGCVPDGGDGGGELYNPVWEPADSIIAMELLDVPTPTGNGHFFLTEEQVNIESYKGTLGLFEDNGMEGADAVWIQLNTWQAIGVTEWTTTDTWIIEVWRDGNIIATTSSDSPINPNKQVHDPDGTAMYGDSIYWQYLVPWHDLQVGDRWVVYKWEESYPKIPEYPPDWFYVP